MCSLKAVVFHDGWQGCLCRFSPGFPLINRAIFFFFINEMRQSFCLIFEKIVFTSRCVISITHLSSISLILREDSCVYFISVFYT